MSAAYAARVYSLEAGRPLKSLNPKLPTFRVAELAHVHARTISATARALDVWRAGLACQLCGAEKPLTVALLRVAWSDDRTQVKACAGCAAVAWRTVEGAEKVRTPLLAWAGASER